MSAEPEMKSAFFGAKAQPAISCGFDESAADRFESLGDNCELGLVMRRFGFEHGGLLRWAFTDASSLLKLLRNDIEDFYLYDNLRPNRPRMVEDEAYSIFWHSTMTIANGDGTLELVRDENTRRDIYAEEIKKLSYLKAKFLARLRAGGIIFVLKANGGLETALVQAIFAELERLAAGAKFWLVHVRTAQAGEIAGSVHQIDEANMVALVKDFAPYTKANKLDIETWKKVLAETLTRTEFPNWREARSAVQAHLSNLDRTATP